MYNLTPPDGNYSGDYFVDGYITAEGIGQYDVGGETTVTVSVDWNPGNDAVSERGEAITTTELLNAVDCWANNQPAPDGSQGINTEAARAC